MSTKSILGRAIKILLIFTIICGILYPLIITGISQVLFKDKANGSMIEIDGVKYGSELLGQQYTGNEYMWGRIMNINTDIFTDSKGNKVMYGAPSNLSPASEKYKTLVLERVQKLKESNPNADKTKIPVDLVTGSGSGLDPHISVAAANYQIERIADSRNLSKEEVKKVIHKYTTSRFWGIFGENVVNVLKVNLALDGILK